MTKHSVTYDKADAAIHLSGKTAPLDTAAGVDDAVVEIIMDLNEASADAKDAVQKKAREAPRLMT